MSEAPYDPYVPKGGADPQAGGQSRTQALQGVSLALKSDEINLWLEAKSLSSTRLDLLQSSSELADK